LNSKLYAIVDGDGRPILMTLIVEPVYPSLQEKLGAVIIAVKGAESTRHLLQHPIKIPS